MSLLSRSLIVLGTIVLASCVTGSVKLFDGQTLQGWSELGDANWSVQGRVITADQGDGYLVSTQSYTDYVLEVEFTVGAGVNSGVFVHCQDETEITPLNCYEINIWDDHPNQAFRTGAIVTQVSPSEKLNTVGQWNRYRILVSENTLQVTLNGVPVSSLLALDKTSGRMAVQHIGDGEVRFRQILVQPN